MSILVPENSVNEYVGKEDGPMESGRRGAVNAIPRGSQLAFLCSPDLSASLTVSLFQSLHNNCLGVIKANIFPLVVS